jgi:hypothetical protein
MSNLATYSFSALYAPLQSDSHDSFINCCESICNSAAQPWLSELEVTPFSSPSNDAVEVADVMPGAFPLVSAPLPWLTHDQVLQSANDFQVPS